MANQVVTDFVVNLGSSLDKVSAFKKDIASVDTDLNNLGKNSQIPLTFDKITQDIRASLLKAQTGVTDLSKAAESANPKPIISRHWQNEADKVQKSAEEIKRDLEQVEAVNIRLAEKDAARLAENLRRRQQTSPLIDSAKLYGESRFNDANVKPFADITEFRKRTDELKNLGNEAERTAAKINKIRGFGAILSELNLGVNETQLNIAITAYEKINERAAKAAESVKSIGTEGKAAGASFIELGSISTAGLATFGLVAIAGAAIVKVTSDIRTEAERRLSVEEKISAAYGKQFSTLYNIGIEVAKNRANADRDRNFNRTIDSLNLDQLQSRRNTTQFLFDRTGDAGRKTQYGAELTDYDKKIDELTQTAKNAPQLAYEKQAEFTRKTYEDQRNARDKFTRETAEFNEKQVKKREEDLKKANDLIDESGKKATDSFTNLYQIANASNPFVSVFSEADSAANKLNETVSFLPVKLQEAAFAMQAVIDSNKKFDVQLNSDFAAFDLRQRADDLRRFGKDPNKPEELTLAKRDPSKFFQEYVSFYTQKLEAEFLRQGGSATKFYRTANGSFTQVNEQPFTQYNRTANNGFIQSDSRAGLLSVFEQLGGGGTFRRDKTLADLTEKEKFAFLNKDNAGLQNKLDAAFDLAGNRNALNDEQKSSIDKKIIALSSGVNPSQLTDSERDKVATALENEARRRENAEENAQRERQKQTELQTQIAENQTKLLAVAEREGLKGIDKLLVEIKDSPTTKSTVQRANPSDTAKQMDLSGTFFEQSQRK